MATPWRQQTINIGVAACSVILVFCVIEGTLRLAAYYQDRRTLANALAHPAPLPTDGRVTLGQMLRLSRNRRIIYELIPRLNGRFIDPYTNGESDVATNAAGFRDTDEYPLEKPKGTLRIVGIGDSIMWGWGLGPHENYLSLLQQQLSEEFGRTAWEVINTSVPGYNTAMEVETLKEKGLAYAPDLVLVGFCPNDLSLPNFIWQEREYLSLHESFLAAFVRARLRGVRSGASGNGLSLAPLDDAGKYTESDPERVPRQYRELVGWSAFRNALMELVQLGRDHQFQVAFVGFLPRPHPIQERAFHICDELGIPIIRVGDSEKAYLESHGVPLASYYSSPLVVGHGDPHPSQLGHRLAAEKIHEFMKSRGLLPVLEAGR